jgi:putative hemolysin
MQTAPACDPFSVSAFVDEPLRRLLAPVEPALDRLLSLDRLRQVFAAARLSAGTGDPLTSLFAVLGITYHVDAADLERIPATGPVLAVANHPFGMLEGAVLAHLLPKIRPDVRILANSILAAIPELRERCIFIDPFGRSSSIEANASALRGCLKWLRDGGLLVTFPAGEVTQINFKQRTFTDPVWNPQLARIAQLAGADVVPIFFKGANSMTFHIAGAVHPRLRTAQLPREFLNKRGRMVVARIGRPVKHNVLQSFSDERGATEYLRCRTYLLDTAAAGATGDTFHFYLPFHFRKRAAVAAAPPQDRIGRDIANLAAARKLCEAGELAVYLGTEDEMPNVVREIGRLREVAFRQAGEGTGRAIDLDAFDRYYLHLVLWNQKAGEVAGAYRLGPTPDILPRYGMRGLYTSTLFRFRKDLFERIGPAVELGRSFIRPEYQKQYAPLLLLWKGIGRYVANRPECATLFGGVSISRDYHPVSRHLLVKFLEAHRADHLVKLVSPRRPYKPSEKVLRRTGVVEQVPDDLEDLSALIADMESDGKGVPILVKQYLKTGGRLVGFNVDPGFSGVLDALIVVDLRSAPPALLERCLGKSGAARFAAWHAGRR